MSEGLTAAIKAAGGVRALARLLGINHQAIRQWIDKKVPAERIVQIEKLTGVDRERLRPDLYRRSAKPAVRKTPEAIHR